MERAIVALGACLLLTLACSKTVILNAPLPTSDGTQSTLLVIREGSTVRVRGVDASGGAESAPQLMDSGAFELVALLYPHTLEELQMARGVIELVEPHPESRPLPRPQAIFEQTLRGDREEDWTSVDALPDFVAQLRVAPLDPDRCLEQRGCFSADDPSAVCLIPCPVPGAPLAPDPPRAPLQPEVTILTPCPAGWSERFSPSLETMICQPAFVGSMTSSCAQDEALFVGESGCTRIGTVCPQSGMWPELDDVAPEQIVYVRAGSSGGTGARETPFATVGEGLQAALAGNTVLVAPGQYDEAVVIGAGVRLLGACAGETTIATPAETSTTIVITGSNARVENLAIQGGLSIVGAASGVELRALSVNSMEIGVHVGSGAEVALAHSVLRSLEQGIRIEHGATAHLDQLFVEGGIAGVRAEGATVEISRHHAVRTQLAIRGEQNTALRVSELLVEDCEYGALFRLASTATIATAYMTRIQYGLGVSASRMDATQIVVEGSMASVNALNSTLSLDRVGLSRGLNCIYALESILTLSQALLTDCGSAGTLIGTEVDARDVTTARSRSGLHFAEFSKVLVLRAAFTGIHDNGVEFLSGSVGTISEITVEGRELQDDAFAHGLRVSGGSTVQGSAIAISGLRARSVAIEGERTEATLADLDIRGVLAGTIPTEDQEGVLVRVGARLSADRLRIRNGNIKAIVVDGLNTSASLDNIIVENVYAGIRVGCSRFDERCALLEANRVSVARCTTTGMSFYEGRDTQRMTNVSIAECATTGLSVDRSAVSISGFNISNNGGSGITVSLNSRLELNDGVVTNNAVGIRLLEGTFSLHPAMVGVDYSGNEVTVERP